MTTIAPQAYRMILAAADNLIHLARLHGVLPTLETEPRQPLAMGNHFLRLTMRPVRNPEPAAADNCRRPDVLEKLAYHEGARCDMSLEECLSFLANGWKETPGRSYTQLVLQLTELLAAVPFRPYCNDDCRARTNGIEAELQALRKKVATYEARDALGLLPESTTTYAPLTTAEARDLTCMLAGAPWPDEMLPELQRLLGIYDGLRAHGQRPVDPAFLPRKVAKVVMKTGLLPDTVHLPATSAAPAEDEPDEVIELRALAATCYAGLGAECNLPENWLDALNAAANGEPFTTAGLLPFKAEPSPQADSQPAPLSKQQICDKFDFLEGIVNEWGFDRIVEAAAEIQAHAIAASVPADSVLEDARKEIERLNAIINTPQRDDFLRAVSTEAEHQRQRWGSAHDAGKTPADWFWLIGYLAGKALHAHAADNSEKAEHHIITTAAAALNWHRAMHGKTDMRPGIDGEGIDAARKQGVA